MIYQTKDIGQVRPLFKKYMWYMKRYFDVEDVPAWIDRANIYLDLYKTESDRRVYVFCSTSEISGFALVNRFCRFNSGGNTIAEFYIVPEKQRKGHGGELAEYVFAEQPGLWEVCVSSANKGGYTFWRNVISDYTNEGYRVQSKKSYYGKAFTFSNA